MLLRWDASLEITYHAFDTWMQEIKVSFVLSFVIRVYDRMNALRDHFR